MLLFSIVFWGGFMNPCCALEYITSYAMEKIFHARWWDYSKMPLNLHGRICM
ncbi:putative ABC transporter permease [uncultured Oscillibacter sp.]|uniref:putative ABC transporter permease n=1 Tax=uncultured Oscillibacter sp. TaxID=876091 RepID=UPI0025CBE349|nr:putative ABC transporter permease [uncultured Oscillibacter sp.]